MFFFLHFRTACKAVFMIPAQNAKAAAEKYSFIIVALKA